MKFLVDMPLSPKLAEWLCHQGHDAVHASQSGLDRASDELVLSRARDEARVIITADLDFPRLLALLQTDGPGLILFRGGDFSESDSIERLRRALESIPADQLSHSIVVVERGRLRKRPLPVQ